MTTSPKHSLQPVSMTWLMDDDITPGAAISLAKMSVLAGHSSELHSHPNCTETIHVLSGTINQRCGDQWIKLEAGQTTLIPEGELHQTRNIGEHRAEMIIVYSNGSRVYDKA